MEMNLIEWPRVKGIFVREDGVILSQRGIAFRKVSAKRDNNKYGHYAACRIPKCEAGNYFFIHRIVCETFHPTKGSDELEVNHIDGDKLNNHPSNLEWTTKSQNRKHAYAIGLNSIAKKRGTGNGRSKLDELQVRVIKTLGNDFYQREIAAYFSVSYTTIGYILRGNTWVDV